MSTMTITDLGWTDLTNEKTERQIFIQERLSSTHPLALDCPYSNFLGEAISDVEICISVVRDCAPIAGNHQQVTNGKFNLY